jgi:hypothetical protein
MSEMELALRQQLGLGELGVSQAQVAQQGQIAEADVMMRAQQLQQQAALEGRSLDLTQARDLASQQLEQARLTQQGNQFGQELEMRAKQLQQEALQFGQNLSLDQARLAAQQEQFTKSQEQDASQFGQNLTQQQKQFQLQLAAALSGLSDAQRNKLLASGAFGGSTQTAGQSGGTTPGTSGGGIDLDALKRQLEDWFKNNPIPTGG